MATDGFVTCLWFDGKAEEAARFYTSVFKDSSVGDTTYYPDDAPGAQAGAALTVDFTANGQRFVGLNGGPEFTFNEAISFQIMCEDQQEVDHYSARLIEDGGEQGPCGWVKDRFGVSWQVVPEAMLRMHRDPDPAKAKRVFGAMMQMHKLDIAALEKAYAGE
ncbi:VOC family protein [Streptomyces sp. NPDC048182]|uniref:VOC family protein n=1 Tax=Streptomyces sp. NPDC048182 TaxID=3365507 RepID=UPI00371F3817